MHIRSCPHCGHPLPGDDVAAAIRGPRSRRLFELVSHAGVAGISVAALMRRLYVDDENGGAQDDAIISVLALSRVNPRIKRFGLQLVCGRGAGNNYRLVKIDG